MLKIDFNEPNIHTKIKSFLDNGYYVYFGCIDDFYMEGKSWFGERHFDHDGMIFGYDEQKQTYDVYAYNKSWIYTTFTMPQKCFADGLHSKYHYTEYATLNGIKSKAETVGLDIKKIKKGITEYLDSSWYKYPPNIDAPVYGIVVHDYISMYMYKLLSNAFPHEKIDRRVYRAIWEHKNVMLQRIEAIENALQLGDEISQQYKPIELEANHMRMLYASYVKETGDAHEAYNFDAIEFDGQEVCLGFVMLIGNSQTANLQIRLENIIGCKQYKKAEWLNPEWLMCDEISEEETPEAREYKSRRYSEYDWNECKEIYNSMRTKAIKYGKTLTFPIAWYTLIDEEGELYRMLVFEDQLKGLNKMKKDKANWIDDLSITGEQILDRYFSYFCTRPSARDIELYVDNVRNCEIPPMIKILEERKKIDPYYVAKTAEENGVDVFGYAKSVYDSSDMIQDIYGSLENYQMEVCKAKVYGDKNLIIGLKVEELPVELIPFDRTPYHNLAQLVQEVKDEMFGGTYDGIGNINWTDKPYKTYYGVFYHDDKSIFINSVLDSENVPKEVVKFVIYHEMLHRDDPTHGKAFREKEHKYPDFENCEAFLYNNMYNFDIKEW